MPTTRPAARALAAALAIVCAPLAAPASAQSPASASAALAIVPAPTSVTRATGRFPIDTGTRIVVDAGASAAVEQVARYLSDMLAPTVGAHSRLAAGAAAPRRSIHLTAAGADESLGEEGYTLTVGTDRVTIAARTPAGLFHGVQTLRQLLPTSVEHKAALNRGLALPAVRVVDSPRFAWRGAMLDVSRHFLPLDAVKRYVDVMALYKLNRLHLHLSDDQGWRIEIRSRPELARIGGASEVGGGPGGYYTQEQYSDLVAYAARRHIVIVPEIDMPGHTNAALASIPALNCDDRPRPIYTGTRVGFSAVCVERDTTYAIITDILRELAELTPGDYLHIGGDEVEKLTHAQYVAFIERVQGIVRAQGKRMIGWGEIAPAALDRSTIVQHWKPDSSRVHAARGGMVILSPNKRAYLDQKYDSTTALGLRWAGLIEVKDAYDWDPATQIAGVPERSVLGVEGPLWSETLTTPADFEFMAFPRLIAIAEVGWSQTGSRSWSGFRTRLAAHGPRLSALGVNFYRSPQVDWAGQERPSPRFVPLSVDTSRR